jgi:hypothetical protein
MGSSQDPMDMRMCKAGNANTKWFSFFRRLCKTGC